MSTRKVLLPRIDDSHHAYLLSEDENFLAQVRALTDSDLRVFSFPVLGINEARSLKQAQSTRALSDRRYLIVQFTAITEEAQNALLKTLEEPNPDTTFVLVTANAGLLLPAFLSRLKVLEKTEVSLDSYGEIEAESFVNQNHEGRLKFVADLIKNAGDAHKSVAIKFLNNLEKFLAGKISLKQAEVNNSLIFSLDQIREARTYLHDKSGTTKLILEHISLVLPDGSLIM